ncbi:hypothetical protein HK104_003602 [Borealophlyctis nickersoniae]|nr:hypothetical protein HK104_003602 [Borealophlyctis nickersoniae]
MHKDTVHVPRTRSRFRSTLPPYTPPSTPHHDHPIWADASISDFVNIIKMLTVGGGPTSSTKSPANAQTVHVVISDIGVLTTSALLLYAACNFGLSTVAKVYWIPYMVVNAWLVLITFLQHTDARVMRFRAQEATKSIKNVLGKYYLQESESV